MADFELKTVGSLATPEEIAELLERVEEVQPQMDAVVAWGTTAEASTAQIHTDAVTASTSAVVASEAADDAIAAKNAAEAVGALADTQIAHNIVTPGTATGDALSATFATKDSAARAARLAARGQSDIVRSSSIARTTYEDAVRVVEQWANFDGWSSASAMQIDSGRVFGAGQGAASGINRAFAVGAEEEARAVFRVRQVTGGGSPSGGVIVGVSRNAAGAAPSAGAASAFGMQFQAAGPVRAMTEGVTGSTLFTASGTVDWLVTLTVDATYVTITAYTTSGGGTEIRSKWDRTAFPVNNIYVFNSDTAGLTGCSVGPVGASRGIATLVPRTEIEGIQRTVHWTTVAGDRIRIALPVGYDSRRPLPAVILFHGNGSDESTWTSNTNMKAVAEAFLAAGFICISASDGNLTTWGNDNSLNAYATAYQYARDRYAISGVVFYANSMGSIESLLTLAQDRIPGVAAWIGTVPTFDLADNFANPLFTTVIRAAYGIASDGSDYAVKTAGHDPALLDPALFRGIPVYALVATDDVSVHPVENGLSLAEALRSVSPVTLVEVTGGHSTSQIVSRSGEMVQFAKTALGI